MLDPRLPALGLLLLPLAADNPEPRFAPAADAQLSTSMSWSLDAECVASDIIAMGEDLPDVDRPNALFLERMHLETAMDLAFVDSNHAGRERNQRFTRELTSLSLDDNDFSFGPFEAGRMLQYSREGEQEAYEVALLDEDGEVAEAEAMTSLFAPAADPRAWLGELDSLEANAQLLQGLNGASTLSWLTPGLELEAFEELAENFTSQSFANLLVSDLYEALSGGEGGQVTWTVEGLSERDGEQFLALEAEVEVNFEGDLTPSFFSLFAALVQGANPDDSELQADLLAAGTLEGTLLWNLDRGHLASAEWEGPLELEVAVEGDVSVDGFAVPVEALFAWEGKLSCGVGIEAR